MKKFRRRTKQNIKSQWIKVGGHTDLYFHRYATMVRRTSTMTLVHKISNWERGQFSWAEVSSLVARDTEAEGQGSERSAFNYHAGIQRQTSFAMTLCVTPVRHLHDAETSVMKWRYFTCIRWLTRPWPPTASTVEDSNNYCLHCVCMLTWCLEHRQWKLTILLKPRMSKSSRNLNQVRTQESVSRYV